MILANQRSLASFVLNLLFQLPPPPLPMHWCIFHHRIIYGLFGGDSYQKLKPGWDSITIYFCSQTFVLTELFLAWQLHLRRMSSMRNWVCLVSTIFYFNNTRNWYTLNVVFALLWHVPLWNTNSISVWKCHDGSFQYTCSLHCARINNTIKFIGIHCSKYLRDQIFKAIYLEKYWGKSFQIVVLFSLIILLDNTLVAEKNSKTLFFT